MVKTMFVLSSEDGYKDMFPSQIREEFNIKVYPVAYKLDGLIQYDYIHNISKKDYDNIADITIPYKIYSYIYDIAVSEQTDKIVVLCANSNYYPFKKNALDAVNHFRRTKEYKNKLIDIEVIDTKLFSVGVGGFLLKAIDKYKNGEIDDITEYIKTNSKKAKTIIANITNIGSQESFSINYNTKTNIKLECCDIFRQDKIIMLCKNHINKHNHDYTVTYFEDENYKISNLIEEYTEKKPLYTAHYSAASASLFNHKVIISMF